MLKNAVSGISRHYFKEHGYHVSGTYLNR